jgi:hypothetical protein
LANATIGAQLAVAMPDSRKNPYVARRAAATELEGTTMAPVYTLRPQVLFDGDHELAPGRTASGRAQVPFLQSRRDLLSHHLVWADYLSSHVPRYSPAMRVVPNARGSEVAFALFRSPGTSDADFESDARSVTRDLAALKALIERS